MNEKREKPLLSGMPEPDRAEVSTHLHPLADSVGVAGCACESCRQARSTSTAGSQPLRADYFGYRATCTTCHRQKQPIGRSAPLEMIMCNPHHPIIEPTGCKGYHEDPKPSNLWPGESEADFGYPVSR